MHDRLFICTNNSISQSKDQHKNVKLRDAMKTGKNLIAAQKYMF